MSIVPWQGRSPSQKTRVFAWLLLVLPVVVALLYPVVQDYVRALSLLRRISDPHATGWLANYEVRAVDARDGSFQFKGRTVASRTYRPQGVGFASGIVVVHGMHELGINEPRLVSLARTLAASGFFVMTPEVPGIADYRVEGESADLIGTAAQSFAQELGVPRVGVLGLSFSGGLALLAASDSSYASSIGWVATVGAHYDLAHVLRFFATGEAVRPDGTVENLTPHEYGPLIVIYDEPQDFFPAGDVRAAREALKLLLAGNGKASEKVTETMTPAGQEIMQHLYHKHREELAPAIMDEINQQQERLAAASPAGHLRFLHCSVLLLHGSDDTVIPPTELLWLKHDIPKELLLDSLISPAISHVEVGTKVSLRDRLALVHWMSLMIHEARTMPDGRGAATAPAGVWLSPATTH